jgi:alkylation response protein AidB-like acyl-CoA dehydrogenase
MTLVPTQEEAMVADAVRALLKQADPLSSFRGRRDAGLHDDPELWLRLARDGFAAPQVPEAAGGPGMSHFAAGLVAEETGRVLASIPNISTAMAARLLVEAGATDLIAPMLAGDTRIAVALEEAPRHDPVPRSVHAAADGAGFRLSGRKRFVMDAAGADRLIVVCAQDAGAGLYLIERASPGVSVEPRDTIDGRDIADVGLDGVAVDASARLAVGATAAAALACALDVGRTLLAAELLGLAQEAFDRTVAYLKEREQFGRKIGTFQALQHRASRLFVALDIGRGVVFKALRALDESPDTASSLASLAKAVMTKSARDVLDEAIQMHGGIGVTDDIDIGLFFKRARVAGELLGDDYFHRERLAARVWEL